MSALVINVVSVCHFANSGMKHAHQISFAKLAQTFKNSFHLTFALIKMLLMAKRAAFMSLKTIQI